MDTGAYSVWPFTAVLEAAQAGGNLPGPYDLPAYRCKVFSVATNKPPFAPYRGVARPGVCFAIELTMDAIARAVGREAVDVRAMNLVPGSHALRQYHQQALRHWRLSRIARHRARDDRIR